MDVRGLTLRAVREALLDAFAVVLPVLCAGCSSPDRGLCAHCGSELQNAAGVHRILLRSPAMASGLTKVESAGLPLTYATDYSGVTANVLHALKESGRTDAARPLGRLLRTALVDAVHLHTPQLPSGERVVLLPVPSSLRSFGVRGYNPVEAILRWAGPQPGRAAGIRYRRTPRDQAALGATERWKNLGGSLSANRRQLEGRHVILVDDVVTTGATLFECRRAATEAGAIVCGGIALAYTAKVKGTNSELLDDLLDRRGYGGSNGAESNRPRPGRRAKD